MLSCSYSVAVMSSTGCRHNGALWRCFRDKLSHDCPELINDFDELLQEVMNDYEQQETSFE